MVASFAKALYPYMMMDEKFHAFPERIEFRGVIPSTGVFQGSNWFRVKLSKPS